ncbi:MAG: hypothetical protein D6754_05530 [Alphaproteobacteria bacterium]|nr:MAG: hypothetical protein D6754_05530 [Alphaproteobacteria bacterium]
MRDDHQGGLLAFLIAAPVMVICCGFSAFLAGALGAIGGWLSGLGWIAVIIAAVGAFIAVRAILRRRRRAAAEAVDATACCEDGAPDAGTRTGTSKKESAREAFDGVL